MHAPAPALLLDMQERLGSLSREALRLTAGGRRPFRPSPGWEGALGELAFAVLSLADQTGVDLEQALYGTVNRYSQRAGHRPAPPPPQSAQRPPPDDWPPRH